MNLIQSKARISFRNDKLNKLCFISMNNRALRELGYYRITDRELIEMENECIEQLDSVWAGW